jgi:hypothetical protein
MGFIGFYFSTRSNSSSPKFTVMKKHILLVGLFVQITMASCIKNLFKEKEESLPAITQTGANTLGCKVEGKVWVPNGTHDLFVSIPALSTYVYQSQGIKYFSISARKDPSAFNKEEDAYDDLSLDVILPTSPSEVIIDKDCNSCGLYCSYSSLRFKIKGLFQGGCYMTSSLYTGKVRFTKIDTVNRIISGTFQFSAIDKSSGKTLNITDGRFDVNAR